MTWGFVPQLQTDYILAIRSELGFRWVWFDGDRDAALRAYLARGSIEGFWNVQLVLIGNFIDPRMPELRPLRAAVFNAAGQHRCHPKLGRDRRVTQIVHLRGEPRVTPSRAAS